MVFETHDDYLAAIFNPMVSRESDRPAALRTGGIGWRRDLIRPSGCVGWYGGPEFEGPGPVDTYCSELAYAHERSSFRVTPRAFCLPSASVTHSTAPWAHRSPHPDCECGWRVSADVRELRLEFGMGSGDLIGPRDRLRERGALVQVQLIGTVRPGVNDPPGTVRAERLRRVGNMYLLRDLMTSDLIESVRKFYGSAVRVVADLDAAVIAIEGEPNRPPLSSLSMRGPQSAHRS